MAAVPTADLTTPLLLDGREPEVILDVGGDESTAGRGGGEWSENPFEFLGAGFLSLPPPSTIDPFRNHTPYLGGVYEWIKILLCVPVALIRLVLFGLCLLIGFLATKLALYGWKDKQRPMPRWRCGIMWVTRICARCILFSFGYHWIRRIGRPALREIAPIVVSNHVSYIEPIFFFYELFPTIVASESHDAMPFVGTIIRAMQVIYVDRFSAPSRKHAVNEIKRKASCNGFPRVLLFPEGTTTNGRSLLTFQLGAFIPGFPIQPVVVRYPHVHFDQSWGNISLAKLMFRMFTQFHNFMEVEYLPIIVPLEKKQENAVHLSQRTSFSMARALNVVPTSYSYGDMMLVTRASQLKKEKSSAYLVEMAWVESSFNISTSEAMEFLDQFLAMNPDSNGRAKIHGFLSVLRLELSPIAEKIFGFFDMEKKGSITFRQFLLGSAHIMKQPLFRHACDTVFNECDDEGTGYISVQKLGDVIQYTVPGMSDPTLSQLFYLFDIDNDGSISRDDFMACLRRNPPLIALFSSCSMSNNQLEVV